MLHAQPVLSRFSTLSPPSRHPRSSSSSFLRPALSSGGRPILRTAGSRPLLAELQGAAPPPQPPPEAAEDGGGPIEIFPSGRSPIFAVDDNPSLLQATTGFLLTGAISVFLFRSLRRRANRAKQLRVRSNGVTKAKGLKAEALESLKAIGAASVEPGKPPSAVQALLGGIAAGVIAIILYKFTTTIEASLNRQTISDNFSVRQITITVRTIVNGICYLATYVFGINSIGLTLYAVQLALGSFTENSSNISPTSNKDEGQLSTLPPGESSTDESSDDDKAVHANGRSTMEEQ